MRKRELGFFQDQDQFDQKARVFFATSDPETYPSFPKKYDSLAVFPTPEPGQVLQDTKSFYLDCRA